VNEQIAHYFVSYQNETEDIEFSDTQMFKLDDVLSAAFQGMNRSKKVGKSRSKQLITFKIRSVE